MVLVGSGSISVTRCRFASSAANAWIASRHWWPISEQMRVRRVELPVCSSLPGYLQSKREQEVSISELFREFKNWWSLQPTGDLDAAKANLADIRRHAEIFRDFLTA